MSQELSVNLVEIHQPTRVTFVHSVDKVLVQPPGEPEQVIDLKTGQAASFSGALAAMYLGVGPGEHAATDVMSESGLIGSSFQPSVKVIDRVLPHSVAEVIYATDTTDRRIYFGNLAIASRMPTDEDRRQARERRRPEQVGDNFEVLSYDHALVTMPSGDVHYMPLDSPQAVLALRVLQALGAYPDDRIGYQIGAGRIAADIWAQMPQAERELFTDDEKRLAGTGGFMKDAVDRILRGLAKPLRLVDVGAQTRLLENRIDTQLVLGPPPEEFLAQDPPTISFSEIEFSEARRRAPELNQTMLERLRGEAARLLAFGSEGIFSSGDELHRRGLDILDVIMPREGKQALRELLGGDRVSDDELDAVIERLEDAAKRLLGESFLPAKRYRTIAGWHAVGRRGAQLRGGTLNLAKTNWTVGEYSKSRAFLEQPSSVKRRIRLSDDE